MFKASLLILTKLAPVLAFTTVIWSNPNTAWADEAQKTDDLRSTPPWVHFNDPVLTSLVERGIANNPGIKAAKARIDMARAGARLALAPLLPSLNAEGMFGLNSYDTSLSGISMPSIPGMSNSKDDVNHSTTLSASLRASYMLDITGRHYIARQAALKEAAAAEEDTGNSIAMLTTQIMQTYYDVISAKLRIVMIEEQIKNNDKLLSLIMAKFKQGIATSLDVLQQRQQLNAKRAQLPLAKTFANISKQQLATLTGCDKVSDLPTITSSLPQTDPTLSEITPKELERTRPDLRAAQRRVQAAEDRASSTQRALFPSLVINGSVGYKMMHITETSHGDVWSAGALLSVPLFMGGANRAALDQARAAKRSAALSYENNLQLASAQVKNTLETSRRQSEYLEALIRQHKDAEQTVAESTRRYLGGLSTYINVLAANNSLQMNELSLIQARRDLLSARINLLNAIGGTWTLKFVNAKR